MKRTSSGNDVSGRELERSTGSIRADPASLLNHKGSSGVVPGGQFILEEAIKPAAGGPTQIKRGSSRPANPPDSSVKKMTDSIQGSFHKGPSVVVKSSRNDAFL